jgi:lysophospholipase L1-like esterase
MKNKILVFSLGIIFTLIALEIALRVQSSMNADMVIESQIKSKSTGTFTILCIGNSHTVGSGVNPSEAYPVVLENILNSKFKNLKIKVYNKGILGANTSIILDELPNFIDKYSPDLIIILAGEPNVWSWYGFSRFISTQNNILMHLNSDTFSYKIFSFFKNIKLLRLTEIITRKNIFSHTYNGLTSNEKIMFWRSALDGTDITINEEEVQTTKKAIEEFISSSDFLKVENKRDYFISLSALYRLKLKDWKKSLELIKKSIDLNNDFDFLACLELNEIIEAKQYPSSLTEEIFKLSKEVAKKSPPPDKYKTLLHLFRYGDTQNISLEDLLYAHVLIPGSTNITRKLYDTLKTNSSFSASKESTYIKKALENLGPYSPESNFFLKKLNELEQGNEKKEINLFKNYYLEKYPQFKESSSLMSSDNLKKWIFFDLTEMIKLIKKNNRHVILMNYHWLKGNYLENSINMAIENAAVRNGVHFSNIHKDFIDSINSGNHPESDYFATKFGKNDNHPSVLGHQIIAKKLSVDIINWKLMDAN